MTQHSQNGEGVEVLPTDIATAQAVLAVEFDNSHAVFEHDVASVIARYRQSLAREPATADVGREGCIGSMDPKRATYFLERFKREEKWLGPHEQWAIDYTIDILAALSRAAPSSDHSDDAAVDRFATQMKAKLAAARAKGRGGWDDPAQCSPDHLRNLLHEHVAKGDPVDVANFCMMLAHYSASTAAPSSGRTSGTIGDGYTDAFYELAGIMGIGASTDSPAIVWRRDMLPRLQGAFAPSSGHAMAEGERLDDRRVINTILARLLNALQPDCPDMVERIRLGNIACTEILALATTPPTTNDAIPAGMVPWASGLTAPSDWDGGPVLLRDGDMWFGTPGWKHMAALADRDIIAYTPKASAETSGAGLREALTTVRDYVADAAKGALTYEGSGDGFIAMAKDDLARIDAVLSAAPSAPATEAGEEA